MGSITLTLIAWSGFCALSLLSPDSNLLGGNETVHMPFAGSVSFFGFIVLGPAVLIVLRAYLQVYIAHGERLDRIAARMRDVRAPSLLPLKNTLVRWCGRLGFYLLLPLMLAWFTWKAAAFPAWGASLLCVAVAAGMSHIVLPFRRVSRLRKALVSVIVVVAVVLAIARFGLPHRPFNLFRANLSNQWLFSDRLDGANLYFANLTHANLGDASLTHAKLVGAKLTHANLDLADLSDADLGGATLSDATLILATLSHADLSDATLNHADLTDATLTHAILTHATLTHANLPDANLYSANLTHANLTHADLSGANLSGANLSGATLSYANLEGVGGLTPLQLNQACGTNPKLPKGFTLKPCPKSAATRVAG